MSLRRRRGAWDVPYARVHRLNDRGAVRILRGLRGSWRILLGGDIVLRLHAVLAVEGALIIVRIGDLPKLLPSRHEEIRKASCVVRIAGIDSSGRFLGAEVVK
jgi:hypothetical protein